jgi:hypothetical protein
VVAGSSPARLTIIFSDKNIPLQPSTKAARPFDAMANCILDENLGVAIYHHLWEIDAYGT